MREYIPKYTKGSYITMLQDEEWGNHTYTKGQQYLVIRADSRLERRPRIKTGTSKTAWYLNTANIRPATPSEYFKHLAIQPSTCVHATYRAHALKLLVWANALGMKWGDGTAYIDDYPYEDSGDKNCYNLYTGAHDQVNYYTENSYTIIPFEEHYNRI